jgi:hypothetical protein
MPGFELQVRPDGDRLAFQVADRRRPRGGAPEGVSTPDAEAVLARSRELRSLVGDVSRAGALGATEREQLVAQGRLLHDRLVPPGLRAILADAARQPLWLRLRGWAAELPWEWLHDGQGTWALRYSIGREVPVPSHAGMRPQPAPSCPARTVVLGDPSGDLPAAQAEVDEVHRALRAVGLRPRTHAGSRPVDDLRVSLLAADIVHIAAHVDAGPDGSPQLSGIRCADGHLTAQELEGLALGSGAVPALLVLNGCDSVRLAPALLAAGCGHVLAAAAPVGDEAARRVAVAFYQGLARGLPIGEALRLARESLAEPLLAAPYVLFGDPAASLAAAFPQPEVSETRAELSPGPAAWVAASFLLEPSAENEAELEECCGPIRQRVSALVEGAGLRPLPSAPDAVVVRIPLEDRGDAYGDVALELARTLAESETGGSVPGWKVTRTVRVGIGVSGGGARAREHAQRLATMARAGMLLSDDRLRALARHPLARWARHGAAALDGSPAWRVDFDPLPGPPGPPPLGRENAVARLVAALEDAVEGRAPRLSVVTGSAGVGKTTLLESYGAEMAARGIRVLRCAASALGRPTLLPPGGGAAVTTPAIPLPALVAAALGVDGPGDDSELLAEPWQWAEAMRRAQGPWIWLLDGVERLGPALPAALESLLDHLDDRPLHVVAALRNDRSDEKARVERLTRRASGGVVHVAPLGASESRQLLRQRLGIDSLPMELEPLLREAGGNPLLLLRGLQHLQHEGALRRPGQRVQVDPSQLEALPPSPIEEALVGARLQALSQSVRAVVEASAILGGEVPVQALDAMPSIHPGAIAEAASLGWLRLRSAASWRGREGWCSLRDPLVLRVVPTLIPAARGRGLHDAALAWHEHRGSPPHDRARHALRSSDALQAIPPLWEEALACREGGDFEGILRALDPLERLIATAPEPDLPVGTPAAATIRALRDAALRMLQADRDPTVISAQHPTISSGFEAFSERTLGPYGLLDVLGIGSTGTVYLAEQGGPEGFRRRVALKVLHRQLSGNERFVQSFLHEARIAARLSHPNIVPVTDLGSADGLWYLAMDYVDGCSVRRILKTCLGGLPADIALCVAAAAAAGLAHAHGMRDEQGLPSPVVHRDICPENLFAARSGVPRIIDFGLARAEDTAGPASESGALRGRAGYAAPERIAGAAVGPATDVWGLGVVLYEMLTGEALFQGRTILGVLDAVCGGDLRPAVLRAEELDPELGHWMRRMLERDPGARMADAAALAEGLDALSRRLSPFGDAPARRLAELVGAVLDEG